MTAPLALYLTRFATTPPPVMVESEPSALEPTIRLTQAELDARIEAAILIAETEAARRHASAIEAISDRSEAVAAEALAKARADWIETEGTALSGLIEQHFCDLRAVIADALAAVLRPLLADAAHAASMQALTNALDRLLADPDKPTIRVLGPTDLLAELRRTRSASNIEWVDADTIDIAITADATMIQACLAKALTDIAATET